MREIFKIIKANFILLLGTGLFIYNLFDFSSDCYCDSSGLLPSFKCINPATYYYYSDISLILLTIGAIFIVIGLLKIRKKKGEN